MRLVIDDRAVAAPPVSDLVGRRRFGDVLLRRRRLSDRVRAAAMAHGFDQIDCARTDEALRASVAEAATSGTPTLLLPGSVWMDDGEPARRLVRRLALGGVDAIVAIGARSALFSADGTTLDVLARIAAGSVPAAVTVDAGDAMLDLDDYRQCLAVLSDAFEARHFNALRAEPNEVVKRSRDRDKIRAEHDYWRLLPESMRRWFVMPYALRVDDDGAEYRMERLQVADVGLQWVHGAIRPAEFEGVLALLSAFLRERPVRAAAPARHAALRQALYEDKVRARLAQLAAHPHGARLQQWLAAGTRYPDLDAIAAHYFDLRARVEATLPSPLPQETIGHGDLCFSNMLYERHARLFKLIDPKGAASEDALWTEPGYDWAKLSHSVLGDYDFINHDQFRIDVDDADRLRLSIVADDDGLQACKARFVEWLQEHGQHPLRVRMDEASLFLSLLPLHLDRPHKVLAFLINAADLLHDIDAALGQPDDRR